MEAGSGRGADSLPKSRVKPGTSHSNRNVQCPWGPKPTLLPPATRAPVGCSCGSQHGARRARPRHQLLLAGQVCWSPGNARKAAGWRRRAGVHERAGERVSPGQV